MERAVIYNRCSTEEEAQMNALEVQAQESREIVWNQGWMLVEQYIESQSGTTAGKRSEYKRLLADMETDRFDIVVIKSIDRLMRSAKDWYSFIDKLTRNRKRLYIYIDHKFYTPDDSLLTGIKAILAEDFSRELSKKIKNAHRRRQEKQTGYNITVPIFGWDKISKDVYVLNEKEAEAYRLAFSMAEQGKGFYSIANQMYDLGVRGKNGNRISDVQWRNLLYSPRAHGAVRLHATEYDFEAKQKVKVPESEWIYIENALPPIITREYHERVLQKMEVRSKGYRHTGHMGGDLEEGLFTRKKAGQYALSGKLYCGECGAVYYRTVVRRKGQMQEKYRGLMEKEGGQVEQIQLNEQRDGRIVWKCSTALKNGRKTTERLYGCNNVNVEEEWILRELGKCKEFSNQCNFKNNQLEEVLALIQKGFAQMDGERDKEFLVKELKKLEKKKNILLNKLMDEVIGDEEFKKLYLEIDESIERMEKRIKSIIEQESEYNDYEKRLSHIEEALRGGIMQEAKVRVMLQNIDRIVVYKDKRLEL